LWTDGRTHARTDVRSAYVRMSVHKKWKKSVRMYGRTDRRTFETGFIRSTLSKSRLKIAKASNSKSDLQGHSMALAMMPFDRPHTIFY